MFTKCTIKKCSGVVILLYSLLLLLFLVSYYNNHQTIGKVKHGDLYNSLHTSHVSDFSTVFTNASSVKYVTQTMNGVSSLKESENDFNVVLRNSEQCLRATNLTSQGKLFQETAKRNVEYFFHELRKLIPRHFLNGYSSHCWNTQFKITRKGTKLQGNIGDDLHFDDSMTHFRKASMNDLRLFRSNFSSEMICLPKLFLAGFPKSGSTFLWCFINKLIHASVGLVPGHAEKEPHFWVNAAAYKYIKEPKVEDFSHYILNFVKDLNQVSKLHRKDAVLMDGSPNLMFNWPRFHEEDPDMSNYCLVPSTLPHFLPNAKFIVIMRNPIKMLYSAFWFSCTMYGIKIPIDTRLKGPSLFHHRVVTKIDMFNECMRDERLPAIRSPCSLNSSMDYSVCINQRWHLLDKCVHNITFNLFTPELPNCGRSRVAMGLYYVHVRKWLSVVPKKRFLFLTLEELIDNPSRVSQDILGFIDMPHISELTAKEVYRSCGENKQTVIDYKHDTRLQMRADTRVLLEEFYQPFNAKLAELLDDSKYMWSK